jgi:hypothetical protein
VQNRRDWCLPFLVTHPHSTIIAFLCIPLSVVVLAGVLGMGMGYSSFMKRSTLRYRRILAIERVHEGLFKIGFCLVLFDGTARKTGRCTCETVYTYLAFGWIFRDHVRAWAANYMYLKVYSIIRGANRGNDTSFILFHVVLIKSQINMLHLCFDGLCYL